MSEQIREFLRVNKPEPITDEERASIMRISKKAFGVLLTFAVLMVIVWIVNDFDKGFWVFGGGVLVFIGAILIVLEVKDKVRYMSYDKIYSTYVYIEGGRCINRAYHLDVCYYDANYGMFIKTKMNIDRVDVKPEQIGIGAVIRVLVGEKNSKIHYIAMK